MAFSSALVNISIILTLVASFYSFTNAGSAHSFVINQLKPQREEIRDWVLYSLIGQNQEEVNVTNERGKISCPVCQLGVTLAFSFLEQGSADEVRDGLIEICKELDVLSPDICDGIIRGFFPHAYHILTNRKFKVDDICGFLVQNQDCGKLSDELTNWEIKINPNKPEHVIAPPLPDGIPTAKVLHLTDIHPDMDYAVGSLTECGKPMCCRRGKDWKEPWNSSVEAGVFGDYKCDMPMNAVDDAFRNSAARYEDYTFVIMGGDYVHHGVWFTTKEDVLRHFVAVSDSVQAAFPPEMPIYPLVGNHENHPSNLFPPPSVWGVKPDFDLSWVYNTLADLYETKLTPGALATFREGGYYTVTPKKGLRVITLNTNFCYVLNFWVIYEPVDPHGQLQWFSNWMQYAEEQNEKVFVLGHIPPGQADCWSVWNKQFNAVVDRYQHLIVGSFYGHTHHDDFRVFFDGNRPSSVAYISPSITAYTNVNPAYKVFHFDGVRDGATWEMVDSETFTYNLTDANGSGQPDWYSLYSTKQAYGLKSLRPDDILDFVLRMAKDHSLFQKFFTHFSRDSDKFVPCDDVKCIRNALCSLLTSNHGDNSHCVLIDSVLEKGQ